MKADVKMNVDIRNVQEQVEESAKQAGVLSRKAVLTYLGLVGFAYDGVKGAWHAGTEFLDRAEKRGEDMEAYLNKQANEVQQQVQTEITNFRTETENSLRRLTQNVTRRGKAVEQEMEKAAADIKKAAVEGEPSESGSIRIEVEAVEEAPFDEYEEMTVQEVVDRLPGLALEDLGRLRLYEETHKNRVTVLREIDDRIEELTSAAEQA